MLKKLLIIALAGLSVAAYADNSNASQGYTEAKQAKDVSNGDNQATDKFDANKAADSAQQNSPTVSSYASSSQLFPEQNQITGTKGQKYNTSHVKGQVKANNPTVSSVAYSGSQFPDQNKLTGKKHEKYYTKKQLKNPQNNPAVNSRMSSASLFPQENSFNNNGKTTKSASAAE